LLRRVGLPRVGNIMKTVAAPALHRSPVFPRATKSRQLPSGRKLSRSGVVGHRASAVVC
jgi:hypothetical protein